MKQEDIESKMEKFSLQEKWQYLSMIENRMALLSKESQENLTKVRADLETFTGNGNRYNGSTDMIHGDFSQELPGVQPRPKIEYNQLLDQIKKNPYSVINWDIRLGHLNALAGNWKRAGEIYAKDGDKHLSLDSFKRAGLEEESAKREYGEVRIPVLKKYLDNAVDAILTSWWFGYSGGEHQNSINNIHRELRELGCDYWRSPLDGCP